MIFQRLAVVLLGLVFVTLIGVIVWSTVTDDGVSPSDASAGSATDQTSVGGDGEFVSPSGNAVQAVAGFGLIVGWGLGLVVVIVRARRRGP